MPIKVLIESIDIDDINKIIEFYNKNKPLENQPLEILDRCEGGFKIMITDKKCKQLRWKHKYLVKLQNCIGFDYEEEKLLYYSMRSVFGNDVIFED
jgi:hypothetical protein